MESSSFSSEKAVTEEIHRENVRVIQWEDLEQELARLLSLSSALQEANQNKILLQEKLQSHIQAEAESLSQLHKLDEMRERLESRELVIVNMSMHTKVLKEKVKKQEEQLSTEIRSLLIAGTALSVASKSLQEANKSLAGERGYTQLKDLQKLLRVRQQYVVSQVSLLYPVKVVVGHASEQELESFTCSKSGNLLVRNLLYICLTLYRTDVLCRSILYAFMQYADQIMNLFPKVFACRSATVHEEAMLAVGALAYATGPDIAKYMPEFYKYVEMGLQNYKEYQVCAVTVGVVGDICRALENKVIPYCDEIMTQLLKDLFSNQLHRSVMPLIFSCFGDIALAIGENFKKYLMYAMPMLQSAAELSAHTSGADDEMIEYTNHLRNGILEAYSGIFQGIKNSPKTQLLIPYAPHILQFLDSIYMEKDIMM